MMFPQIGMLELLTSLVAAFFGIGLPVVTLIFLFMIYNKVKSIEELLKKE